MRYKEEMGPYEVFEISAAIFLLAGLLKEPRAMYLTAVVMGYSVMEINHRVNGHSVNGPADCPRCQLIRQFESGGFKVVERRTK